MRSRVLGIVFVLVLVLVLVRVLESEASQPSGGPTRTATARVAASEPREARAKKSEHEHEHEYEHEHEHEHDAKTAAQLVTISGRVVKGTRGVAGAEVLLRGALGETSAISGANGEFAARVAEGNYRVAVRGGGVTSVGLADPERIEQPPVAGLPDDSLMPVVRAPAEGIELAVRDEMIVQGTVVDAAGRPIPHATVRGRSALRPVLGTDVAESDARGAFELRVPAGKVRVEASHPAFAGLVRPVIVDHDTSGVTLVLARGCIVEGKSAEGAIERARGAEFVPAGFSDGAFRFATLDTGDVTLRAWPWKSPPSQAHTFACAEGARFTGVELVAAERHATLTGTIVDASGAPVPFAYLDIAGATAQQERADAEGRWAVYDLPAGHTQITASLPGRGNAVATVDGPRDGIELRLSGTGQLAGVFDAASSLETSFESCAGAPIAHEPRIVAVHRGRFVIDDVPACDLVLVARWRDRVVRAHVVVTAGAMSELRLQ